MKKLALLIFTIGFLSHALAQIATVSFRFTDNGGRYEAVGQNGESFVTAWSSCSGDSMYAYRDYVKLVGVGAKWCDFPVLTAEFISLDWEQRAPKIAEGQWVVFMNNKNQFLCARVKEVYNRSRGADKDLLVFEYKIYSACEDVAKIILDHHEAAKKQYEIRGKDAGNAGFCFANNSGVFTIEGSHGELFATDWSECGAKTIYAYRDHVKLIAAATDFHEFPSSAEAFLGLDWEQRALEIPEDGWVVFLNQQGHFLCVHVTKILVKSRGEMEDLLMFDYRIYGSGQHIAESIFSAHEERASEYEQKGSDSGRATFCYSHNNGHYTIIGANGQRFVTSWSSCGNKSVYAYRDYVSAIGFGGKWSDFPSSTTDFANLDWSFRARSVTIGDSVVFANSAGAYLCARIVDIYKTTTGNSEEFLTFDFKIFDADSVVAAEVDRVRPSGDGIVSVDISADKVVTLPWSQALDMALIRLIKIIHDNGCVRQYDVSDLIVVPRTSSGDLDLAHAYVRPEIVSEILDMRKGAKIELGAGKSVIETIKTREGLSYEFYQADSLDALLKSMPTETKIGDGAPFRPTIRSTNGNSAFFYINVTK